MTREEAIKVLNNFPIDFRRSGCFEAMGALKIAILALRPVSREQVEKAWRSEWEDMRETYKDIPKNRCAQCRGVFIGLETSFCPACGAPMTDEAVQMVMERMETINNA